MQKVPRGIRNNNPLNIRIGNMWIGEVLDPTDKEFEQFISMAYGIRAGFKLLYRYINRYNLRTIEDIISRWAPRSENYTSNYILNVQILSGIDAHEVLTFEDRDKMLALVDAMIYVECGQHIPMETIERGYYLSCA